MKVGDRVIIDIPHIKAVDHIYNGFHGIISKIGENIGEFPHIVAYVTFTNEAKSVRFKNGIFYESELKIDKEYYRNKNLEYLCP